tara:strand:+ start:560 stop:1123 length:564 start_codon:yes stop_codon:yes gene_type:complete
LGVIFKIKKMKLRKEIKEKKSYIEKYIYVFSFLVCSVVFPQGGLQISPSVVAGCSASLQGYSLVSIKSEFTLGQIAINSLASNDFILTQGFHQPNLGVISIFEDKMTNIFIYPNPTIDILNIDLFGFDDPHVQMQLVDLSGKIIISDFLSTSNKNHQIKTNNLKIGSYILEIIGEKEKDSFKIQKFK